MSAEFASFLIHVVVQPAIAIVVAYATYRLGKYIGAFERERALLDAINVTSSADHIIGLRYLAVVEELAKKPLIFHVICTIYHHPHKFGKVFVVETYTTRPEIFLIDTDEVVPPKKFKLLKVDKTTYQTIPA